MYELYDSDGSVGILGTAHLVSDFRSWLEDVDDVDNLKDFLDTGASLITEELESELENLDRAGEERLNALIKNLKDIMFEADSVLIITDGVHSEPLA